MKNEYGLDWQYFANKLKIIQRDINRYTPDELAREFARLSKTADAEVMKESEFKTTNSNQQ